MSVKSHNLALGIVFGVGILAFPDPSQAASINFDTWNKVGDVITTSVGQADLSSNALQNDDFPAPDNNFNFSNNSSVDAQTLESVLGLPFQSLDPDPNNFVSAFEGSGLQRQYTFGEETTLIFNWTFLTNDQTFTNGGFNFDDYAFIAIDNQIQALASTQSYLNPSTNFKREISGTFSRTLTAGTYSIALGVVDVGSFEKTSALKIGGARLSSQQVPEPRSWLSLLVPLGFLSLQLLQRYSKQI